MKFRTGEIIYSVQAVDVTNSSDPTDVGHIDQARGLIQIARNQSFENAIDTLVHEYLHAAEWNGAHLTADDTETRISAVTGAAVSFLRQYNQQGGDAAFAELMGMEIDADLPPVKSQAEIILSELGSESPQVRHAAVIRHVLCANLTDAQFESYRAKYEAANLNPLLGDCYPRVVRKPGSRELTVEMGTTVRALRRIADRTGRLALPGNYEWCGADGQWKDVWTSSEPPYAARCRIYITNQTEPLYGTAEWASYAQYVELPDGTQVLGEFWARHPTTMLAKCAESAVLSRAFVPCNGLYIAEEMQFVPQRKKYVRSTPMPADFQNMQEQITAARAKREDAAADEIAEAAPSLSGFMQRLHDGMRRAGANLASVRDAILSRVRAKAGMLEEENPEAFAAAVLEETRMVLGRR